MTAAPRSAQTLRVYRADHLRVVNGANLGDGLSCAEDLMPGDIYGLSPLAREADLRVHVSAAPPFRIDTASDVGAPGADLHLDCRVTFMSGNGQTTDALVLVETDDNGHVAGCHVLPLAPMVARQDYALVGIDTDSALQTFARIACVSFTGGTPITLASGAQTPVEALRVGDRVLTRDDGPQEIRWIGHTTTRAVGAFAPIVITKGTLHNTDDLLVSPDHRLFIYQRQDRLGAGRSEVLVKARHLINGTSVFARPGGHVDYYQMLFDRHQIVYAAGIAVESMLIDTRTRAALPPDLSEMLSGHNAADHALLEAPEGLLGRPDVAELLRRASHG